MAARSEVLVSRPGGAHLSRSSMDVVGMGAGNDGTGVLVWDDLTRPEVIVTGRVDVVVENSHDGRTAALPGGRFNDQPTITREGNLVRVQGPTEIASSSYVQLSLPPDASLARPPDASWAGSRSVDPYVEFKYGGNTTVFGDLAGMDIGTVGGIDVYGSVGQLTVDARIWSDVQIANVEGNATIRTPGSVDLRRVTGDCAVTGWHPDITVGWVGGNLTVDTGPGRTDVEAVRGRANLSSIAGGTISVGAVNPRYAHILSSDGPATIEHRSRHLVKDDPGRQALPGPRRRPAEAELARSATLAAAVGNQESGLAGWVRNNPDSPPTPRRPPDRPGRPLRAPMRDVVVRRR